MSNIKAEVLDGIRFFSELEPGFFNLFVILILFASAFYIAKAITFIVGDVIKELFFFGLRKLEFLSSRLLGSFYSDSFHAKMLSHRSIYRKLSEVVPLADLSSKLESLGKSESLSELCIKERRFKDFLQLNNKRMVDEYENYFSALELVINDLKSFSDELYPYVEDSYIKDQLLYIANSDTGQEAVGICREVIENLRDRDKADLMIAKNNFKGQKESQTHNDFQS